jgi:hypothetical protein
MSRKHRPMLTELNARCPHCWHQQDTQHAPGAGTCQCQWCDEVFYYECTILYKTRRMQDLTETEKLRAKGKTP